MSTPPTPTTPKRAVTVEAAAEALSISRAMAFRLIKTGELRSVKIGHARRVPVTALDEFIAARADTP